MSKRGETRLIPVVVLEETQARWLSDLSRAAYNYKLSLSRISQESAHEMGQINAGLSPSANLGNLAMAAQMYYGALRALLTQKWSIFLVADLEEGSKEQAILEIERFTQIALGPPNMKSIRSLDGFTWFKRGFTLDNF